ncbi:YrdB family protein [Paenibacillus chitinolyticus]|uniref:YrdB family protein n=1 Tax=Paenibacillus chitinolyticus TaxID=79263 RepID=UPI002DBC838F|nr:YrdB family protein [Paenibacillus chitinolyticus]MEC0246812.1 YrdB family protein [Paenibacillus chitinolyticus]
MAAVLAGNLVIRFILECCLLVAVGYWGMTKGDGWMTKTLLGAGAPLLTAVVWGLFMSPKASYSLPQPWHLVMEAAIFGMGTASLFAAGHTRLGFLFLFSAVVNRLLMAVWSQ